MTNLEYGLMAELLGKSFIASEAMNCSAPDTGNMEVLAKYGNDAQKQEWLTPLLNGEIRSAFVMTERMRASADAKNIDLEIRREGNEYVLNGSKWWSSGAGDPRCKLYLVMGKSNPNDPDPYRQQSVVIVPAGNPGVKILRALSVYGYDGKNSTPLPALDTNDNPSTQTPPMATANSSSPTVASLSPTWSSVRAAASK